MIMFIRIENKKLKYWIIFPAIAVIFGGIIYATNFSLPKITFVSSRISSTEAIILSFKQPQNTIIFEKNLEISPNALVDFIWSVDRKNLTIMPLIELKEGEVYELAIKNYGNFASASILGRLRNLIGKRQIAKVTVAIANPNKDFYLIDVPEITPRHLPVSENANFVLSKEAIDDLQNCSQVLIKCIELNLTTQRLTKWEKGEIAKEYIISSGQPAYATKVGNFSILSKVPVAYGGVKGQRWKMPFWMGIYFVGSTENGFHELPFINGIRESSNSLGRPVSHGCVRLGIGDAQELYDWAEIGTPVLIHK